jgi:hypothetical protein
MLKNGIAGVEYIVMQDKLAVTKIAKSKIDSDDVVDK